MHAHADLCIKQEHDCTISKALAPKQLMVSVLTLHDAQRRMLTVCHRAAALAVCSWPANMQWRI